jgi:hypothetical protein
MASILILSTGFVPVPRTLDHSILQSRVLPTLYRSDSQLRTATPPRCHLDSHAMRMMRDELLVQLKYDITACKAAIERCEADEECLLEQAAECRAAMNMFLTQTSYRNGGIAKSKRMRTLNLLDTTLQDKAKRKTIKKKWHRRMLDGLIAEQSLLLKTMFDDPLEVAQTTRALYDPLGQLENEMAHTEGHDVIDVDEEFSS